MGGWYLLVHRYSSNKLKPKILLTYFLTYVLTDWLTDWLTDCLTFLPFLPFLPFPPFLPFLPFLPSFLPSILPSFLPSFLRHQIAKSYQVGCIGQNCNIPSLKELNILEQKNPSIKCQLWNPQTCSRSETSVNDNRSHLPQSLLAKDFPKCNGVIVIRLNQFLLFAGRQRLPFLRRKNNSRVIPHPILS